MKRENSIVIELDSPQAVFVPGSRVSGKAILNIVHSIKSRFITLQAYGYAKICFDRWHYGPTGELREKEYTNKKTFFDYIIPLWKSKDASEILPGLYSYSFSFPLPMNCLPNFQGKYGHIRYNSFPD